MKKLLQITLAMVALGATLSFQSCDKIKNAAPSQDVPLSAAGADIEIPPTNDTTAQASIGQTSITINIDQMLKDQTKGLLGFGDIDSIKITAMSLTLNDADVSNNFGNFIYAAGSFNTDANSGSYDPYTIGDVENNPDVYSSTLTIPVTDANQDVKKYFGNSTTFHYIIIAKLRHPVTHTLHCHIDITYDVFLK